jgi:CO dehydrogenase/acetyl-CoA synthase delta subunit
MGPRFEHRAKESRRVQAASTMAEAFPKLKSLTVGLEYFDEHGATKSTHVKYEVNIGNAKAVFRFNCPNQECVRGDFDLTDALAAAVAKHLKTVSGDLVCHGWQSRASIKRTRCRNVMHYTLKLGY